MPRPPAPALALLLPTLWAAPALAAPECLGATPSFAGGLRPVLSGPVQTTSSPDGFFNVHWTDQGDDAVPGEQVEGVPLRVSRVIEALQQGRQSFEARGWRPLVGDGGAGGTDGLDLYLQRIGGYGLAWPVDIGEGSTGSCYMVVDPTLSGAVLESVVVHELHHCVQYRYTVYTHSWLYESTATFEQYRVVTDPVLELGLGFLHLTRLSRPDRPVADLGGRFEYAGFLAIKHWWELGGDEALLALWEALAEDPTWASALQAAATSHLGLDLDRWFLDHAKYNAFACSRDDGGHYSASVLPCVVDAAVPVTVPEASFEVRHEDGPYTASYFEVPAGGDPRPVALDCEAPGEGMVLGVRLVALDAHGVGREEVEGWVGPGEPLQVALSGALDPGGGALLVFASTGPSPVQVDCRLDRAELPPEPAVQGCGCATGAAPGGWLLPLLGLVLVRRRRA